MATGYAFYSPGSQKPVLCRFHSEYSLGDRESDSVRKGLQEKGDFLAETETNLMKILKKINLVGGKTIVLVTHDLEITKYATRVIKISKHCNGANC